MRRQRNTALMGAALILAAGAAPGRAAEGLTVALYGGVMGRHDPEMHYRAVHERDRHRRHAAAGRLVSRACQIAPTEG
jgi:hypothetical protein